jgi:hypothetical protein
MNAGAGGSTCSTFSAAASDILDELRASGLETVRVGGSCPVHEAITYLENQHDRMNYASVRRRGLPIGTGAVEEPARAWSHCG